MNLKTILLAIITAVLAATGTHAQIDSIPGAVLLPRQSDLSLEMDYLLGRKIPARWMLYLGREFRNNTEDRAFGFNNFNNVNNLGFYYKIAPSIALGASISVNAIDDIINGDASGDIYLKLHQRWFFDMRKRIREDRGANNFSGQYIGLSEEIVRFFGSDLVNANNRFWPRFELYYGVQHRFRQHLLMDLSMGFAANSLVPNYRNKSFLLTLAPKFSLSWALFPYGAQKGTRQNLRPRFHEQQRIFKVDLLGLLRRHWLSNRSGASFKVIDIATTLAFEQKWGQLPISTELGIRGIYIRSSVRPSVNNSTENIFQHVYSLETRWFYNKTKKIAAGKAGKNLSGPFVALHQQYERGRVRQASIGFPAEAPIQYHRSFLLWGYQQCFFKRGFAQLKLGAGHESLRLSFDRGNYKEANFRLFSEVRVGLAF